MKAEFLERTLRVQRTVDVDQKLCVGSRQCVKLLDRVLGDLKNVHINMKTMSHSLWSKVITLIMVKHKTTNLKNKSRRILEQQKMRFEN